MQETSTQSKYSAQIKAVQLIEDTADEPIPDLGRMGVQLEPARQAAVCGAAGCRETAQLVKGVIDGVGERVLCAEDMAGLIQRVIPKHE